MRLFIAVDLPDDKKYILQRQVAKLKRRITGDLKWVKSENWHLTLKFLGETDKDKIGSIKMVMEENAENWQQAPLTFKGVAAFPHSDYPRVIITRVEKGNSLVRKIHKDLEKDLKDLGFKRDKKPYSPHLTLARSRRNADLKSIGDRLKIVDSSIIGLTINFKEIVLVKSTLTSEGPIYEKLVSCTLKKN